MLAAIDKPLFDQPLETIAAISLPPTGMVQLCGDGIKMSPSALVYHA